MTFDEALASLFSTRPAARIVVESALRQKYGDHPIYWLEQGFYDLAAAFQKSVEISKQEVQEYIDNIYKKLQIRLDKEMEHFSTTTEGVRDLDGLVGPVAELSKALALIAQRLQKEQATNAIVQDPSLATPDNLIFAFLNAKEGNGFEQINCSNNTSGYDIPQLKSLRTPLSIYSIHQEEIEKFSLFSSYTGALSGALDYVEGKTNESLFTLLLECGGVYVTPGPVFWCLERPKIYRTWENTDLDNSWGVPLISYVPEVTSRYYVGNVRLPRKLFHETKIRAKDIVAYENAELRAAMMRVYDVNKLLAELDTEVLDEVVDPNPAECYQLISVDVGLRDERAKALKMNNATDGKVHVEWVPYETENVDQAIEFRNGTSKRPVALT